MSCQWDNPGGPWTAADEMRRLSLKLSRTWMAHGGLVLASERLVSDLTGRRY